MSAQRYIRGAVRDRVRPLGHAATQPPAMTRTLPEFRQGGSARSAATTWCHCRHWASVASACRGDHNTSKPLPSRADTRIVLPAHYPAQFVRCPCVPTLVLLVPCVPRSAAVRADHDGQIRFEARRHRRSAFARRLGPSTRSRRGQMSVQRNTTVTDPTAFIGGASNAMKASPMTRPIRR